MGRETLELRATMSVSRHNSPEDDQDNAAWNDFVIEVIKACGRMRSVGYEVTVYAEHQPENQWTEPESTGDKFRKAMGISPIDVS